MNHHEAQLCRHLLDAAEAFGQVTLHTYPPGATKPEPWGLLCVRVKAGVLELGLVEYKPDGTAGIVAAGRFVDRARAVQDLLALLPPHWYCGEPDPKPIPERW